MTGFNPSGPRVRARTAPPAGAMLSSRLLDQRRARTGTQDAPASSARRAPGPPGPATAGSDSRRAPPARRPARGDRRALSAARADREPGGVAHAAPAVPAEPQAPREHGRRPACPDRRLGPRGPSGAFVASRGAPPALLPRRPAPPSGPRRERRVHCRAMRPRPSHSSTSCGDGRLIRRRTAGRGRRARARGGAVGRLGWCWSPRPRCGGGPWRYAKEGLG